MTATAPPRRPSPIPATIVTGFLGAGKTTLIRAMLRQAEGQRIALIINEFGELNIDGETLRTCAAEGCATTQIVELSNGCICCTVADDFLPTLAAILDRSPAPDHIVIETSGLALPQPLVRAFGWPGVRGRVTVDGVVTVVDAAALAAGRFAPDEAALAAQRAGDPGLDHDTPIAELFEDQLACADLVVLTKTDLLAPPAAAKAAARVEAALRPGVRVVRAERGQVPLAILLGQGAGAEDDLARRPSQHEAGGEDHDHEEFESFTLDLPEITDPASFAARVGATIRGHDILRLKGFAAVAGRPMRLALQAVGPRVETFFDRPFAAGEVRTTRLVVIGETGLDRAAIAAALAA